MTDSRITNPDNDHCCDQYADLTGLTKGEVKRLGGCGCIQAKRDAEAFRSVLDRIASLPTDPRPDGTFNISRAVIIDMARDMLRSVENGEWSASEQRQMPVPHGVDPDEFRSRKTAGDLRDIAHGRRGIREFIARILIRKIDMGNR